MGGQTSIREGLITFLISSFLIISLFAYSFFNIVSENRKLKEELASFTTKEEMRTSESLEEEISNIYILLEGQSSHIRTIMNMAIRNNHYETPHSAEHHGVSCPECLAIYQEVVKTTPELPGSNGLRFNEFYREPVKEAIKNAN
tara:strand:+ start:990 stop:1421 length:432 start_codon:yes stop_codon:yes gene_type:complete